ncbi:MAG: protein-tyrosine phosphatase family protein [Pseudomonadota bacterium]
MEIYGIDAAPGQIGISRMPGRGGDYTGDLAAIVAWGAKLVLTMTTEGELIPCGAGQIAHDLARHNIAWVHLPIPDFGAPPEATARLWPGAAAEAHDILNDGGRVLTHCYGGCGRSGTAALRLLVERGEDAKAALTRMRAVRPCAIETEAQFRWAASIHSGASGISRTTGPG